MISSAIFSLCFWRRVKQSKAKQSKETTLIQEARIKDYEAQSSRHV
jgi:hypothetical protein